MSDRLVLLSLHHILDLAVAELKIIGKGVLPPLKDDDFGNFHASRLDKYLKMYQYPMTALQDKLGSFSSTIAQTVLLATMDIKHAHRYGQAMLQDTNEPISKYTAKGHFGIAYILQMYRMQHHSSPSNFEVHELFESQQRFLSLLIEVLEGHGLHHHFDHNLEFKLQNTQLFIPPELFQIPAVVEAVELDGRRDLLWRPVGHMFFDNKVDNRPSLQTTDEKDILGRARLHMICASEHSQQYVRDMISMPIIWPGPYMCGLNALHIAAMHGNTNIFRLAVSSGYDTTLLHQPHTSFEGCTYLHWASAYGHLELVKFLLEVFKVSKTGLAKLLVFKNYNDDTALHLAAQHGHTKVVKVLLQHTNWRHMRAFSNHTPFWAAVTGRHLHIMKLLEPFSDVNGVEARFVRQFTPLAEAARQGFLEGIEYLLSLRKVDINHSVSLWDGTSKIHVSKTALEIATEGGHNKCVALLKAHGAFSW
jgi:hypothetical protein